MKTKNKIIIISCTLFVLGLAFLVMATNYIRLSQTEAEFLDVDFSGTSACNILTSSCVNDVFIPHNTSAEYNSFITYAPGNTGCVVNEGDCSSSNMCVAPTDCQSDSNYPDCAQMMSCYFGECCVFTTAKNCPGSCRTLADFSCLSTSCADMYPYCQSSMTCDSGKCCTNGVSYKGCPVSCLQQ